MERFGKKIDAVEIDTAIARIKTLPIEEQKAERKKLLEEIKAADNASSLLKFFLDELKEEKTKEEEPVQIPTTPIGEEPKEIPVAKKQELPKELPPTPDEFVKTWDTLVNVSGTGKRTIPGKGETTKPWMGNINGSIFIQNSSLKNSWTALVDRIDPDEDKVSVVLSLGGPIAFVKQITEAYAAADIPLQPAPAGQILTKLAERVAIAAGAALKEEGLTIDKFSFDAKGGDAGDISIAKYLTDSAATIGIPGYKQKEKKGPRPKTREEQIWFYLKVDIPLDKWTVTPGDYNKIVVPFKELPKNIQEIINEVPRYTTLKFYYRKEGDNITFIDNTSYQPEDRPIPTGLRRWWLAQQPLPKKIRKEADIDPGMQWAGPSFSEVAKFTNTPFAQWASELVGILAAKFNYPFPVFTDWGVKPLLKDAAVPGQPLGIYEPTIGWLVEDMFQGIRPKVDNTSPEPLTEAELENFREEVRRQPSEAKKKQLAREQYYFYMWFGTPGKRRSGETGEQLPPREPWPENIRQDIRQRVIERFLNRYLTEKGELPPGFKTPYEKGDTIKILDGPFKDQVVEVIQVDMDIHKVRFQVTWAGNLMESDVDIDATTLVEKRRRGRAPSEKIEEPKRQYTYPAEELWGLLKNFQPGQWHALAHGQGGPTAKLIEFYKARTQIKGLEAPNAETVSEQSGVNLRHAYTLIHDLLERARQASTYEGAKSLIEPSKPAVKAKPPISKEEIEEETEEAKPKELPSMYRGRKPDLENLVEKGLIQEPQRCERCKHYPAITKGEKTDKWLCARCLSDLGLTAGILDLFKKEEPKKEVEKPKCPKCGGPAGYKGNIGTMQRWQCLDPFCDKTFYVEPSKK